MTETRENQGAADPESFEAALAELHRLVDQLERGELTLDESVSAFEKGTRLLKFCHDALANAEKRVRVLVEKEGGELVEGLFEGEAEA